jgi:hypothetical protein
MTASPQDADEPLPQLIIRSRKMLTLQREDLQDSVETYASSPASGSPFLRDQVAWKDAPHRHRAHQRRLWLSCRQLTRLLLANEIDHLNAAARLYEGPGIFLWAPSSVIRVACEAAARIAYLLDPSLPFELRITRAAGLLLYSADEKVKAAGHVTGVVADAEDRACGERDVLLERIGRAGIGVPGKGKPLISPSGQLVHRSPQVTKLIAESFPERPGLYQQTSAVVHSTMWTLIGAVDSSTDTPDLVLKPDLLELGATALAGLDAAWVASNAFALYFGHNPHPVTARWRRRTTAIDELMRATL